MPKLHIGTFLLLLLGTISAHAQYGAVFDRPKNAQSIHSVNVKPIDADRYYEAREGTWIEGGLGRYRARANNEYFENTRKETKAKIKFSVDITIPCPEFSPQGLKGLESGVSLLRENVLCSSDFNKEAWDKAIPPIQSGGRLSLTQVKLFLQRFSKPGGFEYSQHFEILQAIILDPTANRIFRKDLFFALQAIELKHPGQFFGSIQRYSDLAAIPPYKEDDACRSKTEKDTLGKAAVDYAVNAASGVENDRAASLTSWGGVILMIPSLNARGTEAQITEVKNKMYRTLGTGAVQFQYPGLFISKALLFTKSYVNKLFGSPAKEFTELTGVSAKGSTQYYLLGTSPLESGKEVSIVDGYGIHSIDMKGPKNPKVGDTKGTTATWKHNGETYKADIKLSSKKVEGLIDPSKSPNYDKMWEDKKLSGVVVVSDNLGDFKAKTTEHYIQYYAEQGFDFQEPTTLSDTEAWLKKNISDGTVDYVLKDAHAGGNTSNLVSFSKEHKLLKGVKKLENGKTEEVYILAGKGTKDDAAEASQQKLTYDDMKEWMNEREKEKKGPLVYLNSSCWSMEQAQYEVPAVESPLFVNIASKSKTTTFVASKESTKYHIIEGIREGKSYQEMRDGMKTTKRYQTGTNQYQFPDQDSYIAAFASATEIQVAIKDSKGKEYHLEDAAAAH